MQHSVPAQSITVPGELALMNMSNEQDDTVVRIQHHWMPAVRCVKGKDAGRLGISITRSFQDKFAGSSA